MEKVMTSCEMIWSKVKRAKYSVSAALEIGTIEDNFL